MAENVSSKDINLNEVIKERNMKVQKLFRDGLQVGKEEICTLRDAIVKHSKYISDEFWKSNENFFNNTGADKPFDLYLWKKPTEMITLQQLEEAFLVDPSETFKLRRSLLSEVCKLRNELEKEKLNYNLKKQVFEQEIFYLKENYIKNRPILNKMKRKCIMLHDQRNSLLTEFKEINDEIRKEHEIKEEKHKIQSTSRLNENSSKNAYYFKYKKVFEDYNEKSNALRSFILNEERFIFEKILEMFWSRPNSKNITPKSERPSEKKYWEAFLEFALKENDIDNILEIMEEYRLNLKTYNELAQLKESLILESQDFKCLLKFYYRFNKTMIMA
ncbi:NYD-SP28 domain-containing protein [Trichonephila inaurata madagascariensis]|uniref:NYD-SP28 domain-containing protein n=1 Tax=Trichonephila inaurata madagascariensis TaxID=2747483 RepID=A0A8X6YFB8_9ARAC|nr:NYD-SP28 domain-containing protein [Trichonephila inaurata madagascariensis]